jgi:hypothetical protein
VNIRQTFRQQAEDCANMGSPLMARLMSGLAEGLQPRTPVADHILGARTCRWRPTAKAPVPPSP